MGNLSTYSAAINVPRAQETQDKLARNVGNLFNTDNYTLLFDFCLEDTENAIIIINENCEQNAVYSECQVAD